VDFFAIYVVLEDAWYIMPAAVLVPLKGHFMLAPSRKGQKYERYLEAWSLLRGPAAGRPQDEEPETGSSSVPDPNDVVRARLQRSMESFFYRLSGKR
jgi:hypothetical protein